MALDWIRVDGALKRHPKSVHLCALAGDCRAWTYLIDLWSWAREHQPDGRITGPIWSLVVEQVCDWRGERGKLAEAFVEARWLDVVEGNGVAIHDWEDHEGAIIAKAERDAKRAREFRKRLRKRYSKRSRDVTRTQHEQNADVQGNAKENANAKANVKEEKKEAPKQPAPVRALSDRLVEVYLQLRGEKYPFQKGRDGVALQALLAYPADEVVRRWSVGLKAAGWHHTANLGQLASKWADLHPEAMARALARAGGARVSEADKNWDNYQPKRTADGQVDWEAA